MKTFKIDKHAEIICESEGTRYGFRHLAYLMVDGREIEKDKRCYYNRTWEQFEFESVIEGLLGKSKYLSETRKKNFLRRLRGDDKKELDKQFGVIATVAKMGEIFGKDQKEKNDWKTRMLKAGLENKGLQMPDDWNELSEDTKEIRLNAVIQQLS